MRVASRVVEIWKRVNADVNISGTLRSKVYSRDVLRLLDELTASGVLEGHSRLDDWLVLDGVSEVTIARCVTHGEYVDLLSIIDTYSCARYFNCAGAAVITELPLSAEANSLSRLLGVDVHSQGSLLGLTLMHNAGWSVQQSSATASLGG